jgi:hypothetical protein
VLFLGELPEFRCDECDDVSMGFLMLAVGTLAGALLVGWRLRRYLRGVGDAEERKPFRPPIFTDWPPRS